MTYIDPDLIVDEGTTAEAILAAIADQIPGWEPSEGHVETSLAEALAVVSSTIAVLLRDEARDAFSGFGEAILGVPRRTAEIAQAFSTWAAADDVGYSIPDGSQFVMDGPGGVRIGFATVGPAVIPNGQTSVANVRVVALEPGAIANGLTGAAAAIDPIPGIVGVTLTTETAGGADDEPIAEYADRLADRARRLRTVPVTADDYAAIALDVAGVERAIAVNLLDPANPPAGEDPPASGGHITVYPIDEDGDPVAQPVADAVEALLMGDERPLNVTVHVAEPTYTEVDVDVEVRLEADASEVEMEPLIAAAIAEHLSPATWARDDDAPGRWRQPPTASDLQVRDYEIAYVVRSVPGVERVLSLTVDEAGGSTPGPTLDLDGFAPLPRPGTITVTFE